MKNTFKYSCLYLFLINTLGVASQNIGVEGFIENNKTEKALAGVRVILSPGNFSCITDSMGYFSFSDLKKIKYDLTAFLVGYETYKTSISKGYEKKHVVIELKKLEKDIDPVEVTNNKDTEFGYYRLRAVEGTSIYASKKNEVIKIDELLANKVLNNGRQIFAKVAGLNIWESGEGGIQLGIGGRGLSPKRTSNFNTRQNGYDISADALGYPETYYTPSMEAVNRIEIIRGAASLQYGTQFGGLINFVMNEGETEKALVVESRHTLGSFGLWSSFNRLGGSWNKWQYYVCHQYKKGNGWRPNGDFKLQSFYGSMKYHLNESSSLGIELTKYNYNAHQPGGLTDFLFEQDASQSIRERNWFGVDWNILALSFDHKFSNGDKLNSRFFGLKGNRRSLGYLGMISRTDPLTDRDLIIGEYLNLGNETRWVQKYSIGNILGTFLLGGRIYKGNTNNKQGYGNDGFDADYIFNNINDLEGSDYEFPSDNVSIFLENYMAFNEHWTITPGVRYEIINTKSFGYFKEIEKDLAGNIIFEQNIYDTIKQDRQLVLLGLGSSYKLGDMEVYANFSQNYRAINFTDLRVNNPNLEVDKEIKDERGFNTDIGFRGKFFKAINYDISFFCLYYKDRIGEMYRVDSSTFRLYRYRTNVADSRNIGIECLIELNVLRLIKKQKKDIQLSVFGNAALINAKYLNAFESAIEGKLVELVPNITFKGGVEFKYKNLSCSAQNAFTGSHYTDATNAEYTSSAIGGLIPAYNVIDISLGYEKGKFIVEAGLNNALNAIYFTRRATSYPGPGIIPADPRNIYFTIGLKL